MNSIICKQKNRKKAHTLQTHSNSDTCKEHAKVALGPMNAFMQSNLLTFDAGLDPINTISKQRKKIIVYLNNCCKLWLVGKAFPRIIDFKDPSFIFVAIF
jgi:hypothetical protein